ncbi:MULTISPECIES: MFS transporter [Gordonibacter]|uniref:MFS transporter n=1 Tax=Gordonibacter faecis TaxID=3047475 RepID=A0ABT7DJA5_9ACTN|nr:MFS transporter [Gordonibacter sp. KGMB12511]MDJ1649600.1 MFS transporter [Gordonibacter sp. KGMB12511]HIW76421.1 MFS transporter [Candidatus Gordonibacter avicola]
MNESPAPLSAAGQPLPKRWLAIIVTIWAGQAVSMVTSYAAGYAAVWYVTETTGSALALAIAAICAYLPQGLLSPFGGVIADKYNRKTVMIVADLGIGVVSLVLGFIILMGHVTFGLILFMVVVRSLGQAFHGPAMMAAMPLLVPEKHLLRINTLDQLLMSVASVGAPAFGIFLYTTLGFHSVMFLDFFGAVAAVAGLALAKIPTVHDATTDDQNVFQNMRDGWKALSSTRGLVILIAGITVGMMAFAPLGAVFPLMTYDHFGGDGYMASLVEAAFGIGMIVGSVLLMAWGGGKRLAGLIAVAALIVGVTTSTCGFLTPDMFPAFAVLCAVMAMACAWFNGPLITLVQKNVPAEKTGRALGFTTAALGLASPVGIAFGGMLAEAIGIAPFFMVDGLVCIVLGLLVYLPKSVRALDHNEDAAAEAGMPEVADTTVSRD